MKVDLKKLILNEWFAYVAIGAIVFVMVYHLATTDDLQPGSRGWLIAAVATIPVVIIFGLRAYVRFYKDKK